METSSTNETKIQGENNDSKRAEVNINTPSPSVANSVLEYQRRTLDNDDITHKLMHEWVLQTKRIGDLMEKYTERQTVAMEQLTELVSIIAAGLNEETDDFDEEGEMGYFNDEESPAHWPDSQDEEMLTQIIETKPPVKVTTKKQKSKK